MGEFICVAVPVVFVVGLVALTVRSAVIGWKLRERWGCVHALREAGTGAYRAGAITESRLRGVPWTVMVTGVTGTALSLLTGFVLAPSGFVGALVYANEYSGARWMAPVLMVASLNGIALAIGMFLAARQTLECEWDSGTTAIQVGVWSLLHHGGLIAAFAGAVWSHDDGWWVAIAFASPGLLHAILTWVAGRRVRAIQGAFTDEERDALPWARVQGTQEEPERVVGMLG